LGGLRAVARGLISLAKNDEKKSLGKPPLQGGARMTTEVAVLNKFGVALAADSAVTVETYVNSKTQRKVHNTANKLFTLSKFEPVGIMLYNSVTLGGVPWETWIKVYRKKLFKNKFNHLENYADDFFGWLNGGAAFDENQTKLIVGSNLIDAFVRVARDKKSKSTFTAALDKEIAALKKLDDVVGFDDAFRATVVNHYRDTINECEKICFKSSYLNGQRRKILDFVGLLLTKQQRLDNYSGIVIAGYGENEMTPSLLEYVTDIVVCGRVRYWLKENKTISAMNASEVVPLADDEVIRTLIEGISPTFEDTILGSAINLIVSLPEKITFSGFLFEDGRSSQQKLHHSHKTSDCQFVTQRLGRGGGDVLKRVADIKAGQPRFRDSWGSCGRGCDFQGRWFRVGQTETLLRRAN
jgi:hypothetical protein